MSLWSSPICDIALAKLQIWRQGYDYGEVYSTCKFNDAMMGVIDKPTCYMHKLVWHPKEWEYLTSIVWALSTNRPLVEEIQKIGRDVIPHGVMIIGGARIVRLALFPEHLDELIQIMNTAKTGTAPTSLAEDIKKEGLF